MQEVNEDEDYMIDGRALARVKRVALRLFTEQRMLGDEMRDCAQALQLVVDNAMSFG